MRNIINNKNIGMLSNKKEKKVNVAKTMRIKLKGESQRLHQYINNLLPCRMDLSPRELMTLSATVNDVDREQFANSINVKITTLDSYTDRVRKKFNCKKIGYVYAIVENLNIKPVLEKYLQLI